MSPHRHQSVGHGPQYSVNCADSFAVPVSHSPTVIVVFLLCLSQLRLFLSPITTSLLLFFRRCWIPHLSAVDLLNLVISLVFLKT